jgi:hypothetical protein
MDTWATHLDGVARGQMWAEGGQEDPNEAVRPVLRQCCDLGDFAGGAGGARTHDRRIMSPVQDCQRVPARADGVASVQVTGG